MTRLIAPAKLTVSLKITGVRDDGYHLIDAEMESLDLFDELHLTDGDGLEIVDAGSGLAVDAGPDNLVSRALSLVNRSARIRLVKRIPAGAGLGGGSSDAAAILRWAGGVDPVTAAQVGADVAFCLVGGRAQVTGIGEVIRSLEFLDRTYTLLIPPFGVSTPAVYRRWDEMGGPTGTGDNDLEAAAISVCPPLAEWADALSQATGTRARLAGSGGTWFVEGSHPEAAHRGRQAVVVRTFRGSPEPG